MKSIIPLSIVLLMLLLGIWRIWYSGEATTIYARLAAWSLGFFEGLSVVWSIVCPIIVAVFLPPRPEIGLLRLFLYGEAVLIGICAFLALGMVFWHGRDTFLGFSHDAGIGASFLSGRPRRHLFLGVRHGVVAGGVVSLLFLAYSFLGSADWVDNFR